MFEQILIRFRGAAPLSSSGDNLRNEDDDEDEESGSSDTATSPSPRVGRAGREMLQLPLSRSMASFQLSPSPSLGRSPTPSPPPSPSTSSSSSSSSSPSSSSFLDHNDNMPVTTRSATRGATAPTMGTTVMKDATTKRTTRKKKRTMTITENTTKTTTRKKSSKRDEVRDTAQPDEQLAPRRSKRAKAPLRSDDEEKKLGKVAEGGQRGQKRKASEMAAAQPSSAGPEKRVTRAEAKKQEEEDEGRKIATRSGRHLVVAEEGEQSRGLDLTPRTSSSSGKRKSPFLEVPGHLLKRPASQRSVRSSHDEGDVSGTDGNGDADDDGDADEVMPDDAEEEGPASRKSAAGSQVHDYQHRLADSRADESRKHKLHPLLRQGPDNPGFPWWHNDAWMVEEAGRSKKRRIDATTEIFVVGGSDDEGEGEKGEGSPAPSHKQSPKQEGARLLRSTRGSKRSEPSSAAATTTTADEQLPPRKRQKIEVFEWPAEVLNAPIPDEDPLSDERFAEPHRVKRDQEKAEHLKELQKEGKNFTRYMGLLGELEGAEGDDWMGIIGADRPDTQSELSKLVRKKDRLVEELRTAQRRYPAYKRERDELKAGNLDPTYAGWLKRTGREPLSIAGRLIGRSDLEGWGAASDVSGDEDRESEESDKEGEEEED
ncbi:hypothetical protein DRE_05985 [Drechslerella stenobrocha 248]|uniref:Something about silencing protein 4 domain-containing protein n=1 Tax=Drechslerella stenobrocha 248 TaxID=1043628 RepID=W7HZ66_9PEZI|nr:hypothetical protein DRE_05985 [Drechslerella stenobrocha 248]